MRTEEDVDKLIEDMINRTKGKYLTQGVAFNKTCPRQMEILKKALMSSISFSGLMKETLAIKFSGANVTNSNIFMPPNIETKTKSVGNFL